MMLGTQFSSGLARGYRYRVMLFAAIQDGGRRRPEIPGCGWETKGNCTGARCWPLPRPMPMHQGEHVSTLLDAPRGDSVWAPERAAELHSGGWPRAAKACGEALASRPEAEGEWPHEQANRNWWPEPVLGRARPARTIGVPAAGALWRNLRAEIEDSPIRIFRSPSSNWALYR